MQAHFLLTTGILLLLPYAVISIPKVKNIFPLVVLQILVGIFLGPTLLGKFFPNIYTSLFSTQILNQIDTIGQYSLIFLGFLIGLHLETNEFIENGYKKNIAIGVSSVAVPFLLTLPVAFLLSRLFPSLVGSAATELSFMLSISLASSVTALPVLGAILLETGMLNKLEGRLAILFASVNDIFLWILLILIVGLTSTQGSNVATVLQNFVLLIGFVAFLFLILKPFLKKRLRNLRDISNLQLGVILTGAILSGFIAELAGLQPILGAFLFGVIIPKKGVKELINKIEPAVSIILVPFFLVLAGLKTSVNTSSVEIWAVFAFITVVSMTGNFVGIAYPAYRSGFTKYTSVLLGIFMQCKGLMEIVVLNTFLNAHILSQNAYSGMILMAVFTTALTQPLTLWYTSHHKSSSQAKK